MIAGLRPDLMHHVQLGFAKHGRHVRVPFSLSPVHLYPFAETRLHLPDVMNAASMVGQCGEASISARS